MSIGLEKGPDRALLGMASGLVQLGDVWMAQMRHEAGKDGFGQISGCRGKGSHCVIAGENELQM